MLRLLFFLFVAALVGAALVLLTPVPVLAFRAWEAAAKSARRLLRAVSAASASLLAALSFFSIDLDEAGDTRLFDLDRFWEVDVKEGFWGWFYCMVSLYPKGNHEPHVSLPGEVSYYL